MELGRRRVRRLGVTENEELAVPGRRHAWSFAASGQLHRLERVIKGCEALVHGTGEQLQLPAWMRVTAGERRWPVTAAVLAAVGMQLALPERLAPRPRWLLPGLEIVLLIGLWAANPGRIERTSRPLRTASLTLIGAASVANGWSAAALVLGLVRGREGEDAGALLVTGAAIWLTNVLVFALWYWEFDRGGPVARAQAARVWPDFLFPQMQSPELAPADWEPRFADYLYLSFTNATAFSPTDVLPLTRWAKMTMLTQSAISLITVALVVARAVNVLR